MNDFLSIPILLRSMMLFLVPLLVWFFLGTWILWGLSWLPLCFNLCFGLIYRVLEMPVAGLHRHFGGKFYRLDNALSGLGARVSEALLKWHEDWHERKKAYHGVAFWIYLFCVALVSLPSILKWSNTPLNFAEERYLFCESFFLEAVENWTDFDSAAEDRGETIPAVSTEPEETNLPDREEKIALVVSGVQTSLLVRDLPTTETDNILDRIQNDDRVLWNGQMAFSKDENGVVEAWVWIATPNGIEGWSRLSYLLPEGYESAEYFVIER